MAVTISDLVTRRLHPSLAGRARRRRAPRAARAGRRVPGRSGRRRSSSARGARRRAMADIDRVHVAGYADRIFAAPSEGMLDAGHVRRARIGRRGAARGRRRHRGGDRGRAGRHRRWPRCARPATTRCPTARWASACSPTASIAVRHAQYVLDVGRVAVIDWDVHHGNGTQAVFYEDPSVLAVSLHESPHWPYSGDGGRDRRGAGPGDDAERADRRPAPATTPTWRGSATRCCRRSSVTRPTWW